MLKERKNLTTGKNEKVDSLHVVTAMKFTEAVGLKKKSNYT